MSSGRSFIQDTLQSERPNRASVPHRHPRPRLSERASARQQEVCRSKEMSGRHDSNVRPLRPERSALARLSYAPSLGDHPKDLGHRREHLNRTGPGWWKQCRPAAAAAKGTAVAAWPARRPLFTRPRRGRSVPDHCGQRCTGLRRRDGSTPPPARSIRWWVRGCGPARVRGRPGA
jgi:hypothetical protein